MYVCVCRDGDTLTAPRAPSEEDLAWLVSFAAPARPLPSTSSDAGSNSHSKAAVPSSAGGTISTDAVPLPLPSSSPASSSSTKHASAPVNTVKRRTASVNQAISHGYAYGWFMTRLGQAFIRLHDRLSVKAPRVRFGVTLPEDEYV